jgi:hypothetical protein
MYRETEKRVFGEMAKVIPSTNYSNQIEYFKGNGQFRCPKQFTRLFWQTTPFEGGLGFAGIFAFHRRSIYVCQTFSAKGQGVARKLGRKLYNPTKMESTKNGEGKNWRKFSHFLNIFSNKMEWEKAMGMKRAL